MYKEPGIKEIIKQKRQRRKILKDLLSKDANRVWRGASWIISMGQEHSQIQPFVKHLSRIKKDTWGLSLGGMIASNQRILDLAIKTIEFHGEEHHCFCELYALGGADCFFDPKQQEEKGYVKILESVPYPNSRSIDHYLVECTRCGRRWKVVEGVYHMMWWEWMDENG